MTARSVPPPRADQMMLGKCPCGDVVIELRDQTGAIFAEAHIRPEVAVTMAEGLIQLAAESAPCAGRLH